MIQRFLYALLNQKWQDFQVIHHEVLAARRARYGGLKAPLPEPLLNLLQQMGISKIFSHQAEGIESIRCGSHVVVATPTSSGKSLIYNLAVTEALLADPGLHALYLFPIKALTRDQLDTLDSFFRAIESPVPFRAGIYDGDTPPYQRSKIRQNPPQILLTNPDMLHYALLPYHAKWESFWKRLRFVVIDELHTYRGVFGSHVAQILRRLQRICHHYGSQPQFIMLSATIANPLELASQVTGQPQERINVITESGAPQAKRNFVFLEADASQAGPASGLAARLIVRAAESGLKTIAFTQSRKMTELVHMSVSRLKPSLAKRVSSYRAGYLPEERREIEQRLADGSLMAVISTSALEMGIDIGGLDLCILVGYPGTVMTTWQRGGRVGRGGQESAIVLIPHPDALDQYIVQHPREFLSSGFELAVTDPYNVEILKAHLPCAAAELPLERREIEGETALVGTVSTLARDGKLLATGDGGQWLSRSLTPHRDVDIRSVGASYAIQLEREGQKAIPIGRNDGLRALKECHPGAIYLHRGESYHVKQLDLEKRLIHVVQTQASFFTRVKSEKETEILEVFASKPVGNFIVRMGRLRVTEFILSFEQRKLFSQELLSTNPLDLPPQTFETVGFWIEIEPAVAKHVQDAKLHFMGGIHALEHALISMFPLFALCDRNDIGGISIPLHPQLGKGAVFIYDGYPGGIGLAARGYDVIESLLTKTRELVESCSCSEGCPACIHSPKCGSGNKPLDKQAALAIARYLLGEASLADELQASLDAESPIVEPPPPSPEPEAPRYRIGFFDLETQRLAQEVGGWQNTHLMRVSVAVLYETLTDTFHVYRENDLPELFNRLQELDLVVGFNISRFDYKVLQAYTPLDLAGLPTLDMLETIHQKLGFRLSLDHLAEHTLGARKDGDGLQAVQWFRDGKWEPLIAYCKKDVAITRDLFEVAQKEGYLLYRDKKGKTLRLPIQWELKDLVKRS
ncbi:MAG: DEAD/DEAH box helicase [Syntrophobacteraceae bacterium]